MTDLTPIQQVIAPVSDRLCGDDLIAGPRTIKFTDVRTIEGDRGKKQFCIRFEGDNGRPWYPCKTMARAMVLAWSITDESQMVGKSVRVYRDPDVDFGNEKGIGGVRISHMSHLPKAAMMKLTVSQGKKGQFTFTPLPTDVAATAPKSDVEQWADKFMSRAKACNTDAELNALVSKELKWLDKLPDLLRADCDTAVSERLVELMPGRDASQMGDQFPGDDDGFGD